MVNLYGKTCEAAGCSIGPSFGFPGDKARRCGSHKDPGMVNVNRKTCDVEAEDGEGERAGCSIAPSFGFPGDKRARRCCSHKDPGMVRLRKRSAAGPAGSAGPPAQRREPAPDAELSALDVIALMYRPRRILCELIRRGHPIVDSVVIVSDDDDDGPCPCFVTGMAQAPDTGDALLLLSLRDARGPRTVRMASLWDRPEVAEGLGDAELERLASRLPSHSLGIEAIARSLNLFSGWRQAPPECSFGMAASPPPERTWGPPAAPPAGGAESQGGRVMLYTS